MLSVLCKKQTAESKQKSKYSTVHQFKVLYKQNNILECKKSISKHSSDFFFVQTGTFTVNGTDSRGMQKIGGREGQG